MILLTDCRIKIGKMIFVLMIYLLINVFVNQLFSAVLFIISITFGFNKSELYENLESILMGISDIESSMRDAKERGIAVGGHFDGVRETLNRFNDTLRKSVKK